MNQNAKKWLTFSVRWGVAVAGIAFVLYKTPFHDRILLVTDQKLVEVSVLNQPAENAEQFTILDPTTHLEATIPREQVWTQPDVTTVRVKTADGEAHKFKVLAIRPGGHDVGDSQPAELLVKYPKTGEVMRIPPSRVPGGYTVRVPYPLVDIGVDRLVRHAHIGYLLLALAVLPFSYWVTSRRWHMLLEALDIRMSQFRSFVLNMVGAFYNSFMPGSTGGDLIKAYYASKHTTHKVRAILSVIVDRVVGLLALIVFGGVMAATQWQIPECRYVAMICLGLIAATVAGTVVFYHPAWRRATGLEWLLKKLPMQRQIHHAIEAMELYGKRPGAPIWGGIMTFPVHLTTIISAIFAGKAFGLTMSGIYYFTVVPVLVLVSAIPISPQGAGVMEFFSIELTRTQGVTVSQAIALAMAVRLGQMFWNLVAGVFVLRGGYHAITEAEKETLETDEPDIAEGSSTNDSLKPDPTPGEDIPPDAEAKARFAV